MGDCVLRKVSKISSTNFTCLLVKMPYRAFTTFKSKFVLLSNLFMLDFLPNARVALQNLSCF